MNIAVIHPESGWILSSIALKTCAAMPEVFRAFTYAALIQETEIAVDAFFYLDIQNSFDPKLVEYCPTVKHVGAFTHLDHDADVFYNDLWSRCDGVIHMCERYRERFEENGWYRPEQMTVLRPGEVSHIPLAKIKLGIVQRGGREGKGSEFLRSTLETIDPEIADGIEFHICGQGWELDSDYCLGGVKTVLYPESAFEEMPQHYDYLLIPSLYEGGPMALLEALAAGRQVIAPRIGWVPEFIDEDDELLYNPGNGIELRNILALLIIDRLKRRELVRDMSYAKYAADVLSFIENLEVER